METCCAQHCQEMLPWSLGFSRLKLIKPPAYISHIMSLQNLWLPSFKHNTLLFLRWLHLVLYQFVITIRPKFSECQGCNSREQNVPVEGKLLQLFELLDYRHVELQRDPRNHVILPLSCYSLGKKRTKGHTVSLGHNQKSGNWLPALCLFLLSHFAIIILNTK